MSYPGIGMQKEIRMLRTNNDYTHRDVRIGEIRGCFLLH